MKIRLTISAIIAAGVVAGIVAFKPAVNTTTPKPGEVIDSLNGVYVYENGGVHRTYGRHVTPDQYNLGIKYQCVEFVKRYYYQQLHHKMPDTYGDAKDYFDPNTQDGSLNKARNLFQYVNGSKSKPRPDDLVVFGPTVFNAYGHVAIISQVTDNEVEIIQQNAGTFSGTRARFALKNNSGNWFIASTRIKGWLRIPGMQRQ